MLNTVTFTCPATSTLTSIPNWFFLGLKKFSSRYNSTLGVGVGVSEPNGVGVKVGAGVLVMVGVMVTVGVKLGVKVLEGVNVFVGAEVTVLVGV